ncbi:MAG: serine/threonine-protein kinase [Bryobacteraceae bacterium]|jgi:tetratricopeptide (TPR) repeat protein/predicted Ser/Thr protein kinase
MIASASRRLGKYEIRRKLGRGGMADVYLAKDTESGQTVALKLIEHSTDADTRDAIAAEMRGAVLQERLAAVDPRVVRVYGAGDVDGFFFVAMEYVDGQDLAELMRRGPLHVEFAADVASAVAHTLENAHQLEATIDGRDIRGMVHGDIKPKNIRIDARGEVRVLDFGIAKALSLSRRLTRNEFGSVPYASPERLETGTVDAGSDLWSLAVMLYEMATGMQPYQADSTERLERMIRSRIPPPPAPDPCPEAVRRILMKALASTPEARYQTAHEFEEDLQAFREGQPVKAVDADLDATRRTFRADRDETRRTVEVADDDAPTRKSAPVAATPAAATPKPAPAERGELFYWGMRAVAAFVLVAGVGAAWEAVSDYRLYQRGREFEHDVAAEQITDPNQIWDRWAQLSRDHSASLFLNGPRRVVEQRFVAVADHVIDTYRNNEALTVYEADWQRARTMLLHALSADPDDRMAHGKLRLAEGHLARIDGTSHKSAAELNDAVEKFTEAQRFMPQSPDPALGLARVYVYGLKDIDRASQAFDQAASHGYKLGNREKSQLADGYRERADRLWWDSHNVRGLPQEKDQIQRAADDYKRALDLYQQSAPYGNANVRMGQVQSSLESVNFRLAEIDREAQASAAPEHGRVAGAIVGLIDALRGKAAERKGTGPEGKSH